MLSYHGSARPRNAASSPSSERLDAADVCEQGDRAGGVRASLALSSCSVGAGSPHAGPRQTSFGNGSNYSSSWGLDFCTT